jgi:hypothetical protein
MPCSNRLGIGSSLWSAARGLARNVVEYNSLLMAADRPKSERAPVESCRFFLRVSIDQVRFMQTILDPSNLLRRMDLYCRDEVEAGRLPRNSFAVLREVVLGGEVGRGNVVAGLVRLQERAARTVTADLIEKKLLVSTSPRAALRLGFPVAAVERWFPSLYPTAG